MVKVASDGERGSITPVDGVRGHILQFRRIDCYSTVDAVYLGIDAETEIRFSFRATPAARWRR